MSKNKKTKVVKVKEDNVMKKSDFEDENDNKKILVVALILALLIGGFAYVRSLDDKKEDKNPIKEVEKPVEKEEEPVVEQSTNNETVYVPAPVAPVEVIDIWKEVKLIPTLVEAGAEVELPSVTVKEEDKEVSAVITYMYRVDEDSDYIEVEELDTTKLGEYLVTYTLTYASGKVETMEVVIKIEDTLEPVVNNISDGKHYKDDILLDITEYSPYVVELDGVEIDPLLPITEEGEHTLVITEQTELESSITIKFTIDKTLPEVTFTLDLDNKVVVNVVEENIEETIMTKDDIEVDFLDLLEEEGKYSVTVTDKAGNSVTEEYVFDVTAPVVDVTYTPNEGLTDEKVVVTITSNEELQELTGWTLSEDKLSLTKEYSENISETIEVKDLVGNKTQVEVVVDYINHKIDYVPTVTIENLITNGVKATITSLKQLTISNEWTEIIDGDVFYYEKLYFENKVELVDYSYLDDENNVVSGQIKVEIEGFAIEAFVTYDIDPTTQNVTAYAVTKDEVKELPEGWVKDDEYMAEDFRYYKVYTENVPYELVEFVTDNNTYVAIIVVDTIDREEPTVEVDVTYIKENNEKTSVVIVVNANEEIIPVEGWTLSEDKDSILKIVTKPSDATTDEINDKVTITDLKGNTTEVEYSYNWNNE